MGASLIVDKFIDDYEWFRGYCDLLEYSDQVNPVDNTSYPGINISIPEGIRGEVITKLQRITNTRILRSTMFLRLTCGGTDVPHQAHNDASMGQHVCIVYINRPEHCKGGTSFVKHKERGMANGPSSDEESEIWQRDTNDYDKWEITEMYQMVSNRALIFDSSIMHRAEPPSGFGDGARDGRLVLSCFF